MCCVLRLLSCLLLCRSRFLCEHSRGCVVQGHSREGLSKKIMLATLFQRKGLSRSVTVLDSREKESLKGPCSYTQPSKLEQPGPPLSHSLYVRVWQLCVGCVGGTAGRGSQVHACGDTGSTYAWEDAGAGTWLHANRQLLPASPCNIHSHDRVLSRHSLGLHCIVEQLPRANTNVSGVVLAWEVACIAWQ